MSECETKVIRKYLKIRGLVQGVGFRYRAEHAADMIGVTGWVRNDPDGATNDWLPVSLQEASNGRCS